MSKSHGRVESESRQVWSKYHPSHQNHQTPTKENRDHTSQDLRVEEVFNKMTNRVKDRRKSFARKQSLPRGELLTGSSSPIKNPASTADPSPVRPALLYPSARIQ